MTRPEFERLAGEAVGLIPLRFRRAMRNLAVIVEDEPAAAVLAEMGITPPDSLYGLYSGTPLTERTWGDGNRLPDCIALYQRPIEEDADNAEEVRMIIAETILHEVGHYFGLSEEEIEEIEEQYWRARDGGDDPA